MQPEDLLSPPGSTSLLSPASTATRFRGRNNDSLFYSPFISPGTPSVQRLRSGSSAADVIQRFESTQSATFKEYRSWKESKWGEDELDEVEFEDDDMNLELSLPTVFSNPIMPSLKDFSAALGSMLESLQARTIAVALSLCDLVFSAEYYLSRPRELLAASAAMAGVWIPQPPSWFSQNLMHCVGDPAEKKIKTLLDSPSWRDDDELMRDDDQEEDTCSVRSAGSQFARHVTQEAGRIRKLVFGFAFGIAATISFALVYVFAALSLMGNALLRFRRPTQPSGNAWMNAHPSPSSPETTAADSTPRPKRFEPQVHSVSRLTTQCTPRRRAD